MKRVLAAAGILCALALAGCGSSKRQVAPTVVPRSSATTSAKPASPTTSIRRTTAATSTATATQRTTTSTPRPGRRPSTTTAPVPGPITVATQTVPASVVQQTVCPTEQNVGITAVFGRAATRDGAKILLAKAQHVGFQNLSIQQLGCHVFAVVLPTLESLAQGAALRKEAGSVGFHLALACRSLPVAGGLNAVFGHRRTRRQAARLLAEVRRVGFQSARLQEDRCNDWEVDVTGLQTSTERRDFQREAKSVGLTVTYEPG